MFTKKQQNPVDKSVQKVLDEKNDCFNRLKHMRIILDNYELSEAKAFFQAHFHHIYFIFFNAFTTQEALSKQKGQKQIREEYTTLYEPILFLFEKILTLLPEQIERKWQFHSVIHVMKKLLNPGNSFKIRQEGIRLFLIWYQIIGETNDATLDNLFAILVPGIVPNASNLFGSNKQSGDCDHLENSAFYVDQSTTDGNSSSTGGFNDSSNHRSASAFNSCDNEPLIPAPQSEPREPKNYYFLQYLMDYLVSQVSRIYWREPKEYKQRKCFNFVFEKFKTIYLPHLFPKLDTSFSIYAPTLEVPTLRKTDEEAAKDRLAPFKCVVILWLAKYMRDEEKEVTRRRNSYDNLQIGQNKVQSTGSLSSHESNSEWREPTKFDYDLVRSTFCSTRANINLLHQIFRQAFLMPFQQASTMNIVVSVYRNWILCTNDVPIFMRDPSLTTEEHNDHANESIKAGPSALYRVFIANAANIFLLQVPLDEPKLLDEQVEMCKRVLNTWRYMLMELEMNKCTWELLLSVLLRITSFLYTEKVPPRKEDSLGGRLAPAFFQTLVVGMIKANLEAYISANLWEQFQSILTNLTQWEELIKDWSKNMESLTRNVSYHVYHINLHDLPLERLVDKRKRTQKGSKPFLPSRSSKDPKKASSSRPDGSVSFSPGKNLTNNSSNFNNNSSTVTSTTTSANFALIKRSTPDNIDSTPLQQRKQSRLVALADSYFTPTLTNNLPIKLANASRGLVRSPSDSQLLARKRSITRKRAQTNNMVTTPLSSKFNGFSRSLSVTSRSKSLDLLSNNLTESPSSSQSSVYHLRSPSPTPSSGLDANSLKDSPCHIEHSSLNSNASNFSSTGHSVAAGGSHRGWSAESSFIIWRRMLGSLGDVNQIKDPQLHYQVMDCLSNIIDIFLIIRDNLGVSVDNLSTPPPPTYIPPFHFFASWLFATLQLSNHYRKGKTIAYKLLCLIAVRMPEINASNEFLSLFYSSVHRALHSKDLETLCTIIRYSGVKLFSSSLKGSSVLLLDFIHACDIIVNAKESKDFNIPRFEALSMLGTLLSLTDVCRNLKVLDPESSEPVLINCGANTKELILKILMGARKQEQTDLARCVVLNCLGMIVYQDLKNRNRNMSDTLPEIINIFIAETRFNNRYLSRVACDMLKLQTDHINFLVEAYPSIPRQIVEGLIFSITNHLTMVRESNSYSDYRNLLLSLLMCLGQWCLCLPRKILFSPIKSDQSPVTLFLVIQVLNHVISELNCDNSSTTTINNPRPNNGGSGVGVGGNSESDFGNLGNTGSHFYPPPSFRSTSVDSFSDKSKNDGQVVQLAAKMILGHILYFLDHFPLPTIGASRLSSCVNEADDNCFISTKSDQFDHEQELTSELFNAPNVLVCMVNNSSIVSFVDLSCGASNENALTNASANLIKNDPYIRIIVRDVIGKFTWDCCPIFSYYRRNPSSMDSYSLPTDDFSLKSRSLSDLEEKEEDNDPCMRNDPLDLTLREIGKSIYTSKKYFTNTPVPALNDNLDQAEENMMALLGNQHYQEMNFIERPLTRDTNRKESNATSSLDSIKSKSSAQELQQSSDHQTQSSSSSLSTPSLLTQYHQMFFMHCRQLIDQVGFMFWEKRPHVELLNKNDKTIRELKNLDNQKCRETHKIAVIYVADGQEDKNSILLNKSASVGFEKFVAGLGWEVDLETHSGFKGGLQSNKSTGVSAPYYADSFCEVIFHVSTRIPAKAEESDSLRRKLTHLGNDEVHIVWSEHSRDYRRGIIPTEFCDVLIVIYPLGYFPGFYRIDVSRKPEVPFFGPLYPGAIVHHSILADLIRATAINASRAQRLQVPFYQHYFEERSRSIDTIYNSHRDLRSFEDYTSAIFSPSSLPTSSSTHRMSTTSFPTSSSSTVMLNPTHHHSFVPSSTTTSTVHHLQPNNQDNLTPPGQISESNSSPRSKYRPLSMSNIEHKLTSKIISQ